ncbi:MAG: hypothetical protein OHK0017_09320 [Patescibacteria group bacterium]
MFLIDDLYQSAPTKTPAKQTAAGAASQATQGSVNTQGITSLLLNFVWFVVGSVVVFLVIYLLFNLWARRNYKNRRTKQWSERVFLEITVPKESTEEYNKNGPAKKDEKEIISVGEQIFLVLSAFAIPDWKQRLFGTERFSFEVVNIDGEVRFWVICSRKISEVLEKQITAHFGKAHIEQDTNPDFFKKDYVLYGEELVLTNDYILPFRTYRNMEADPLNTLTNSISKIAKDESLAIQFILTPVKDAWQNKPRLLALKIQQGQNPKDVLDPKTDYFKGFREILWGVISAFLPSNKPADQTQEKQERKIDITGKYTAINLTPQQQEIIKKLEEKASRPGFLFTLRVVASAKTSERANQIVRGVVPAFEQYTVKPFNGFKKKNVDQHDLLENFVLRAPNFNQNQIINTEEATSIWHLPNHLTETPNIKWLQARKAPIPLGVPEKGPDSVLIGTSEYRGVKKEIYLKTQDRLRHTYVLGGSGSGKSVFLTNMILQDIEMGNGCCVVDPHGELIDDVLLRIPPDRIEDVIVFNPAYIDRPIGLNMLETDPNNPVQKTLVIDDLFTIFDKLYDLKATGGPIFESYMKNAMRLVMGHPESGNTLMEISKVMADEDFRSFKLAMCDNQEVVDFWEKEAQKAGGDASLENMVPYITSKLAPFVTNDFVRPVIGQQKSAINFRQAMDNKKIILCSLAKGQIGEGSAYLVGMIILGKILMAGMGRADGLKYNEDGTTEKILAGERPKFFVYIDEMQNFLFDSIPKALEEIRKYGVGFNLAHQFVKQIINKGDERIKDSIMANAATKIIFRCGPDDAQHLEKIFAPQFSTQDLMNPEKYTANIKMLADGQLLTPFNIRPINALSRPIDKDFYNQVIERTKQKYGRPREEIEKEIRDRAKLLF